MTEFVAYLGAGGTLIGFALALWLALRVAKAEKRVGESVAARLKAEADLERALSDKATAVAARDSARRSRDDEKRDLDRCREEKESLYAKLRAAGGPGAGASIDDRFRRVSDEDDHEDGSGSA